MGFEASDYYSEQELAGRGFASSALRAAMKAGELEGVPMGAAYAYRGGSLTDWLRRGAPTVARPATGAAAQPAQQPSRRDSMPTPAARAADHVSFSFHGDVSQMSTGNFTAQWESAVEREMSRGKSKAQAIAAVVAAQPDLHRAYLDEYTGRPTPASTPRTSTTTFGDPIAAWDEAVAAEMARGRTKSQAISSVVQRDPDLHKAYLEAYNAQHAAARTAGGRR